jgi:hypothetical protein
VWKTLGIWLLRNVVGDIVKGLVKDEPPPVTSTVYNAVDTRIKETKQLGLPTDPATRKKYPVATGVLGYFPDAIAEIAHVSWQGNQQHNPGQPLHWAREKSTDHPDCLMRHFLERGTIDTTDGMRHSAKLAWRALALLQLELEAERKQGQQKLPF